jgi:hypothetical protein
MKNGVATSPCAVAISPRRAAGDVEIDRHNGRNPADDRVAAGEEAAITRAVANGDDPFRVGRRVVRARKRLAHVPGDRSGDQ